MPSPAAAARRAVSTFPVDCQIRVPSVSGGGHSAMSLATRPLRRTACSVASRSSGVVPNESDCMTSFST